MTNLHAKDPKACSKKSLHKTLEKEEDFLGKLADITDGMEPLSYPKAAEIQKRQALDPRSVSVKPCIVQ